MFFFQATRRVDIERALIEGMEMIGHLLKDMININVPIIHQIFEQKTITIKIEIITSSDRTVLASQK